MRTLIIFVAGGLSLAACGGGGQSTSESTDGARVTKPLRVYDGPYDGVDWASDLRLKAQHHDHPGTSEVRLRAYDAAGYAVVSLMEYSGAPVLSYAWQARRWPVESWLTSSFLASLRNVKLFIPNAEEVGDSRQHMTSPFLARYIEVYDPLSGVPKQDWQYADAFELPSVVSRHGGIPCLAHSWNAALGYDSYPGLRCVEIYNALGEVKKRQGDPAITSIDANALLVGNWDRALARDQYIMGIAVNDHFGPYAQPGSAPADVLDSGKIIVLAKEATLGSYRDAFERGAVFAVRDLGTPKDGYPRVTRITREDTRIRIESDGTVQWIANGNPVTQGPEVDVTLLPRSSTYVRAEISGQGESVVYTQAFVLRPLGDVDGDFDEDSTDKAICDRVTAGTEVNPVFVAACSAIAQSGTG